MKRGWLLVLLISLGLNVGLGYRLWQLRCECPPGAPAGHEGRGGQHGRRGFAPGDSLRWRDMAEQRVRVLAERLSLAPEQVNALQEVQLRQGRLIHQNRQAVEGFRRDLHAMMAEQALDRPAVRAAMHELGRRQALLDSLVTETVLLEMEILDPDQRAQYRQMMPFERESGQMGRRRHAPGPGGQ